MLGLEATIKELEAMDTQALIRIIIHLGDKVVHGDDKDPNPGEVTDFTKGVMDMAIASTIFNAECATCDDSGSWSDAIVRKLGYDAMATEGRLSAGAA
jgi:hypothetical protein